MPQGLQVWDSSGVNVLDTTDSLMRVIGVIQNITQGDPTRTITNSLFGENPNRGFAISFRTSGIGTRPTVTISGNVLTYSPGTSFDSGTILRHYMIYGVYA